MHFAVVGYFSTFGRRCCAVILRSVFGCPFGPCSLRFGFGFEFRHADVVTSVVVSMLTEVLTVLGSNLATFGGLLDAEADATALQVDLDDGVRPFH